MPACGSLEYESEGGEDERPAALNLLCWREQQHSLHMPLRRRPRGPAGGQFSSEDRPNDPPLSEDGLPRQAIGSAADPEDDAAREAETSDDEFRLSQEHFRGRV